MVYSLSDETRTKLRTDRHLLIARYANSQIVYIAIVKGLIYEYCSEYEYVARRYVQERGLNATVLKVLLILNYFFLENSFYSFISDFRIHGSVPS